MNPLCLYVSSLENWSVIECSPGIGDTNIDAPTMTRANGAFSVPVSATGHSWKNGVICRGPKHRPLGMVAKRVARVRESNRTSTGLMDFLNLSFEKGTSQRRIILITMRATFETWCGRLFSFPISSRLEAGVKDAISSK